MKRVILYTALSALTAFPSSAYALNERAAEKLVRDSDCMKCHAISKKKEGPSYKEVAQKYRGKLDAEEILYRHVTTQPIVKVDGKEERHERLKTNDPAEIRNVIQWILSR